MNDDERAGPDRRKTPEEWSAFIAEMFVSNPEILESFLGLASPEFQKRFKAITDPEAPAEMNWLVQIIVKSAKDSYGSHDLTPDNKNTLSHYQNEIREPCSLLNSERTFDKDNTPFRERTFFLGGLEAGFMIGSISKKSEAAKIVITERNRKGGRERGQQLTTEADKWKEAIRPIFIKLREDYPMFLDAKLAREAIKAYGDRKPYLPGHERVRNVLREMIEAKEVPEGRVDGRSKRVQKPAG